ncbi:hypothetical protein GGQ84_000573 [Desulfitispora alkaliphila]|uniref:hypothetical protein n=1 Tax=Desulfitispora alkaliphila TaxID=622674 RepID=UPI003D1E4159
MDLSLTIALVLIAALSCWIIAMVWKAIVKEKQAKKNMKVVIKAKNCEETVEGLLFYLSQLFQRLDGKGEAIVILSESQDNSREILMRLCRRYNWLSLLIVDDEEVSVVQGKPVVTLYLDRGTNLAALMDKIESELK